MNFKWYKSIGSLNVRQLVIFPYYINFLLNRREEEKKNTGFKQVFLVIYSIFTLLNILHE